MLDDRTFGLYIKRFGLDGMKEISAMFFLDAESEQKWRDFLIKKKKMTKATKQLRVQYRYVEGRSTYDYGTRGIVTQPDYRAHHINIRNGRGDTLINLELEESEMYDFLNGSFDEKAQPHIIIE